MRRRGSKRSGRLAVALGLAAVLAGCGGGTSPLSAATTTTTTPPTTAAPTTTSTTTPPTTVPKPKRRVPAREAVSTSVYDGLSTIPTAVLAADAHELASSGIFPTSAPGPSIVAQGKAAVVFVGAEWCPYCAVGNWPLVVALSQFGAFSHLASVESSSKASEVYRSLPGISFYGSSYSSKWLTFAPVETGASSGKHLQTPEKTVSQVMSQWDPDGAIPFLFMDGTGYMVGSGVNAQLIAHRSFTSVAGTIVNGGSALARSVDGNAGVIVSWLCKMTGGNPGKVCADFPKPLTS